jgi:hypothetical protein
MISVVVCEAVIQARLQWNSAAFAIGVTEFVAAFKLNM